MLDRTPASAFTVDISWRLLSMYAIANCNTHAYTLHVSLANRRAGCSNAHLECRTSCQKSDSLSLCTFTRRIATPNGHSDPIWNDGAFGFLKSAPTSWSTRTRIRTRTTTTTTTITTTTTTITRWVAIWDKILIQEATYIKRLMKRLRALLPPPSS